MKKVLQNDSGDRESMLVRINSGQLVAAPKKTAPKKQISLNNAAKKVKRESLPGRILNPKTEPTRVIGKKKPKPLPGRILRSAPGRTPVVAKLKSVETIVGEKGLNVNILKGVPLRHVFKIAQPGKKPLPGQGKPGSDSRDAVVFRAVLTDLHARFEVKLPTSPSRKSLVLHATALTLRQALNPAKTIPKRIRSMIAVPTAFRPGRPIQTIEPIMAHPVFADPMYVPLRDHSPELLIPNVNLIPMNTIALLETNRRFIEAYMVGLNHEMSRELLWREYPTDQRGSYFRQFWDVSEALNHESSTSPADLEEALLDIKPIHTWKNTSKLGDHAGRNLPTGAESQPRLVVVIRGDLLKKYPTAVIFAQRAKWVKDQGADIRVLDERSPEKNLREPIFKAEIDPDLKFLGFDLTAAVAKGSTIRSKNDPGWFFVIQERPGEPRFGLDLPSDNTSPTKWDDLAWNHLAIPAPINFIDLNAGLLPDARNALPKDASRWGSNSADMAYVLFQTPVMVAFHAANMLLGLEKRG